MRSVHVHFIGLLMVLTHKSSAKVSELTTLLPRLHISFVDQVLKLKSSAVFTCVVFFLQFLWRDKEQEVSL